MIVTSKDDDDDYHEREHVPDNGGLRYFIQQMWSVDIDNSAYGGNKVRKQNHVPAFDGITRKA